MENKNAILLGLSGGIDSEYSARLLMNRGYDVHGMYINMLGKSTSDVERVASSLGISLSVAEKADEFEKFVVAPFSGYYQSGKTPNPCVECNRFVKIQTLFEESERMNIPYVATGHYARITTANGRFAVSKAADTKKDQSYFLWKLTQKQLEKLVFPLGDICKEDILKEQGEKLKGYKESQDICFIKGDYRDFLTERGITSPKGNFITACGDIVGMHSGIQSYTRGQRKGLGIALGYPAFVTEIDAENNNVILGTRQELEVKAFKVKDLNCQLLENVEQIDNTGVFNVKTRYRASFAKAMVKIARNTSGELETYEAYVELETPDALVSPGQSAVFYTDECVAFGGEISEIIS